MLLPLNESDPRTIVKQLEHVAAARMLFLATIDHIGNKRKGSNLNKRTNEPANERANEDEQQERERERER